MTHLVIGIAGGIGSGKSTVARLLASRLECPLASYGEYFRGLVNEADPRRKRDLMQSLSDELIDSIGVHGLTKRVLAHAKWTGNSSLVVDGVRSVESIKALRLECQPIPVILVYLEVDEQTRLSRFKLRDRLSNSDLKSFDMHATEKSVHTVVKSLANIVIEANGPAEEAVEALLRWLKTTSI